MKKIQFILAFIGLVTPASAQGIRLESLTAQYRSDDSVAVRFTVFDRWGHATPRLSPGQLRLVDDGTAVKAFSLQYGTEHPAADRYIVLLLDVSGSMRFDGKIEDLKSSAARLVRSLGPGDRCAIVTFSTQSTLACGFTNDSTTLLQTLAEIRAGGYTALMDGVHASLTHFESLPSADAKIMLLISDGREDGHSLLSLTEIAPKLITLNNFRIHAFDLNRTAPSDDLLKLTTLTGGTHIFNAETQNVFADLAGFLSHRDQVHTLTFAPAERHRSGTRMVSITTTLDGIDRSYFTAYDLPPPAPTDQSTVNAWMITGGVFMALGLTAVMFIFLRRSRNGGVSPETAPALWTTGWNMPALPQHDTKEHTQTLDDMSFEDERTLILDRTSMHSNAYGELVLQDPDAEERRFVIDSPEMLIGRSPQCAVRFSDQGISRLHAKLRLEGERVVIYDLGSANGTFINGEEIQQRPLRDGDTIEVGDHRLAFHSDVQVTI